MNKSHSKWSAARCVQIALFCVLAFCGCGKKTERVDVPFLPSHFAWTLQRPLPLGVNLFTCVCGSSAADIYVLGAFGRVAHFDGRRWTAMEAGGYMGHFQRAWASSDGDVFALGYDRAVLRYNGTSWNIVQVLDRMNALWGTSSRDVWTVGDDRAAHYDGVKWTLVMFGKYYDLRDVWGDAADDYYAVGDSGAVLHYDGTRWSRIDHGLTYEGLWAVWGSGRGDVWAVGQRGAMLHFDGAAWSLVASAQVSAANLSAVSGTGPSDVYVAASSAVWRYDGSTFTRIADYEMVDRIVDMQAFGGTLVCASTSGLIYTYGGSAWTEVQGGPFWTLYDVWTDAPNNAWAVGDAGTILHYDGVRWSGEGNPAVTQSGLQAISGSRNSLFAVGYRGTILHYDGNAWSDITYVGVTDWRLTDVWATGNEAFAVGIGGAIVHVTGTRSRLMNSYTSTSLNGVWGSAPDNVFAVGERGTILHYNGTQWSPMNNPAGNDNLTCIWGTRSDNVYAAGGSGTFHYDGIAWARATMTRINAPIAIWGSSPNDIYGTGFQSIDHLEDGRWVESQIPGAPTGLIGIAGSSPHNIFVVGDGGLIIHYGP